MNKTLIINKYGVVTITAITKESNNYTQARESKDITINRATPFITWNISDTLIVGNSIHLDAVASNNAEVLYEIIGEEGILKYDNQAKTLTAMAAGTTTILAYTEENDIYTEKYAAIKTYMEEEVAKFVTCARPLDEYEDFVAELYAMGLQDAIDAYQAAYDRFLVK